MPFEFDDAALILSATAVAVGEFTAVGARVWSDLAGNRAASSDFFASSATVVVATLLVLGLTFGLSCGVSAVAAADGNVGRTLTEAPISKLPSARDVPNTVKASQQELLYVVCSIHQHQERKHVFTAVLRSS